MSITLYAFAAIGWFLFLLMALLYVRRNRLTSVLALLSLALLLSDEFRAAIREGIYKLLLGGFAAGEDTEAIVFTALQAITAHATQGCKEDKPSSNTLRLVNDVVENMRLLTPMG